MTSQRLVRTRREALFLGVCSGISRYFGWDVGVVRLGWIVLTIAGGSGILLYFLAALVMSPGD